jgi:hypothetical protein
MKLRHVEIKVRKYADGRWGYDDYSSGQRKMVRLWNKQKAEARATDILVERANKHTRPDLIEVIQRNGFVPVPPPLLRADEIMINGTAVPNKPGIYFIWEGPLVAYVGQSNNLAQRLLKHPHLQPDDKISYLCVDSSELFYHEAFYIGICRPLRNGGLKQYQKYQPKTLPAASDSHGCLVTTVC